MASEPPNRKGGSVTSSGDPGMDPPGIEHYNGSTDGESCSTPSSPKGCRMIHRTPFTFFQGSLRLAGLLFRNTDRLDVRQPAIIVTGSWLTVKEQMPELYATRLAERGYTTFTFDFSGFGESSGEPRQAEMPDRKIADLLAAADFLSTL